MHKCVSFKLKSKIYDYGETKYLPLSPFKFLPLLAWVPMVLLIPRHSKPSSLQHFPQDQTCNYSSPRYHWTSHPCWVPVPSWMPLPAFPFPTPPSSSKMPPLSAPKEPIPCLHPLPPFLILHAHLPSPSGLSAIKPPQMHLAPADKRVAMLTVD